MYDIFALVFRSVVTDVENVILFFFRTSKHGIITHLHLDHSLYNDNIDTPFNQCIHYFVYSPPIVVSRCIVP